MNFEHRIAVVVLGLALLPGGFSSAGAAPAVGREAAGQGVSLPRLSLSPAAEAMIPGLQRFDFPGAFAGSALGEQMFPSQQATTFAPLVHSLAESGRVTPEEIAAAADYQIAAKEGLPPKISADEYERVSRELGAAYKNASGVIATDMARLLLAVREPGAISEKEFRPMMAELDFAARNYRPYLDQGQWMQAAHYKSRLLGAAIIRFGEAETLRLLGIQAAAQDQSEEDVVVTGHFVNSAAPFIDARSGKNRSPEAYGAYAQFRRGGDAIYLPAFVSEKLHVTAQGLRGLGGVLFDAESTHRSGVSAQEVEEALRGLGKDEVLVLLGINEQTSVPGFPVVLLVRDQADMGTVKSLRVELMVKVKAQRTMWAVSHSDLAH